MVGLDSSRSHKMVSSTDRGMCSGVTHVGVYILTLSQRLEMIHIFSLNCISSPGNCTISKDFLWGLKEIICDSIYLNVWNTKYSWNKGKCKCDS